MIKAKRTNIAILSNDLIMIMASNSLRGIQSSHPLHSDILVAVLPPALMVFFYDHYRHGKEITLSVQ